MDDYVKGLYPNIIALFSDDVRAKVLAAPSTNKPQPLARLLKHLDNLGKGLSGDEGLGYTVAQTEQAIGHIRNNQAFAAWLTEKSEACADTGDYQNASGALAELRALGTMLSGEMPIAPVPTAKTSTPDFRLQVGGVDYYVEVTCKQMYGKEAKRLAQVNESPMPPPDESGVSMRWTEVAPHGGTESEAELENAAQKLAQIKPKSKQAQPGARNLLWLDMQDEDMWSTNFEHASPVASSHNRFYGGAVWYAFYGKKGLPLLEHHHIHAASAAKAGFQSMRFEGRFRQGENRYDAAVLSFPEHLIVFDNPWRTPLFASLATHVIRFLRFAYQYSWLDWPLASSLEARVDAATAAIESIAAACSGYSYPDTLKLAGVDKNSD